MCPPLTCHPFLLAMVYGNGWWQRSTLAFGAKSLVVVLPAIAVSLWRKIWNHWALCWMACCSSCVHHAAYLFPQVFHNKFVEFIGVSWTVLRIECRNFLWDESLIVFSFNCSHYTTWSASFVDLSLNFTWANRRTRNGTCHSKIA